MAKTFEDWQSEELEITFGINRLYDHAPLQQWLSTKHDIDQPTKDRLLSVQQDLIFNADYWNEDELKFFFISQVVATVGFNDKKFKAFSQRPIMAKKKDLQGNEVELKGRVEFVVATGKQNPRQPFFFLHEYKPEKRREADPLGQLLSAMLAARELNQLKHPLYGCYVVGRMWFFVLLDTQGYAVSLAYDATQNDLFDIYAILQECREQVVLLAK